MANSEQTGEIKSLAKDLLIRVEEFELSHQKYEASTEEVMRVNEELQSTNEELETSNEGERKLAELQLAELNATLEKQVSLRTELLAMLQRITRAANEAKAVEEAMKAAIEQICIYNGWTIGNAWQLADDESGQMENSGLWYVRELSDGLIPQFERFRETMQRTRFSPGQGLVGAVMKSAAPQWVDDISGHTHTSQFPDLALRAAIAFPVMIHHEVVAVMEFLTTEVTTPQQQFLEIVPDVGIQLGHVIARNRLEKIIAGIAIGEQMRIGCELHDGIAQQLTGGALIAQSLKRDLPPEPSSLREGMDHLQEILKRTQLDVRRLTRGLLPMSIQAADLLPMLNALANETTGRYQVPCEVDKNRFDESFVTLDSVAFIIYQIACEAVHNAIKHADARRITIDFICEDVFRMAVCDDGVGMEDAARPKANSHGLRIMRYRAESVGGKLEIEETEGNETRVLLTIPKQSCQT